MGEKTVQLSSLFEELDRLMDCYIDDPAAVRALSAVRVWAKKEQEPEFEFEPMDGLEFVPAETLFGGEER